MDYCLLAAGACTEVHYSREGLQGWGLKYIIFFWTKKKPENHLHLPLLLLFLAFWVLLLMMNTRQQ